MFSPSSVHSHTTRELTRENSGTCAVILPLCLTNLIGSGFNVLCLQSHSIPECRWTGRWTGPEVAILGADQKKRGLWGRECTCYCNVRANCSVLCIVLLRKQIHMSRHASMIGHTMIGQMAIAIALRGFNDLGRSVTPTFLFRNRFYLQLSSHCPKMNKKAMWDSRFLYTGPQVAQARYMSSSLYVDLCIVR